MAARYKVVLVGDSGVGKTSLFHRILFGYFTETGENSRSTMGFDCFEKSFNVLGELVEVELHDSPGKVRFETQQISSLYRNSSAVLLVYSVYDASSFYNLRTWVKECQEYMWGNSGGHQTVWAVVGNKSDLPGDVSAEVVDDLLSEMNIELSFEVSTKTGDNVEEMFTKVIEAVHERKMRNKVVVDSNVLRLGSENAPTNTSRSSLCNC